MLVLHRHEGVNVGREPVTKGLRARGVRAKHVGVPGGDHFMKNLPDLFGMMVGRRNDVHPSSLRRRTATGNTSVAEGSL